MSEEISFFASFGEALRTVRKQKQLTQRQLAQLLGVHINTISGWELGSYLPETRGIVLELARHLDLDQDQTRQFLEASLTALNPYWGVPLPRNPFFTGREEILKKLEIYMGGTSQTQSYALYGLGGVGKTQLALEYAYRHAFEYTAVFWINAEADEHIVSSIQRIAEILRLPEHASSHQQHVVEAVRRWLITHSKWLLIWDNLEDLELLNYWMPLVRRGGFLITTRSQMLGPFIQGIDLPPMGQEEGIDLLLRRTKLFAMAATLSQMHSINASISTEYAAARELVQAMGGLSLALDQAGAYVEETGCSLEDYLKRYQWHRLHMLGQRGALGGDHPQSVAATFLLASEQVERRQPAARSLLKVCAFLRAEAIPEELFLEGAAHLGEDLASLATNPVQFDQAIATLRSLSLIQRHAHTRTLSVHCLVQEVLREQMEEQERIVWLNRVLKALAAIFPKTTDKIFVTENIPGIWEQCERLLPHVYAYLTFLPEQTESRETVEIRYKVANYLHERGQYQPAEAMYWQALRQGEKVLGTDHPGLFSVLNSLAYLSFTLRKFDQAEALYQRAQPFIKQIKEAGQGEGWFTPFFGLGMVYIVQGRYQEAEDLYHQTMQLVYKIGESDPHPGLWSP